MKYRVEKYGSRNYAVYRDDGDLVCVTVYRKGAVRVVAELGQSVQVGTGEIVRSDVSVLTLPHGQRLTHSDKNR